MKGMTLVGRQTPTEGGPLDLLGVDGDGRLVVFELKRGTLSRDAVAQIVDYASDLNAMEVEELAQRIGQHSGKRGIDKFEDFKTWYRQSFEELEALLPPRMFLVGLGVDSGTERMVNFLAKSGVDIGLITLQSFEHKGNTLFAKQVKVEGKRRLTNEERRRDLIERAERHGISDLYDDVRKTLKEAWPSSKESPRAGRNLGFNVRMRPNPGQRRDTYARIDPNDGRVRLVFFRCAVELCIYEFEQAVKCIEYDTWPKGKEPLDIATREIQFLITPKEWEAKGFMKP